MRNRGPADQTVCNPPDRVVVLRSAGNLATTQDVLDRIQQDLDTPDHESLATVEGFSRRRYTSAAWDGRRPAAFPGIVGGGCGWHCNLHPRLADPGCVGRHPARLTKIALGSMMSTAHANPSGGPPYDLAVYRTTRSPSTNFASPRTPSSLLASETSGSAHSQRRRRTAERNRFRRTGRPADHSLMLNPATGPTLPVPSTATPR